MARQTEDKNPLKGLYGKDLVNKLADRNGMITSDVGFELLMGRTDSNSNSMLHYKNKGDIGIEPVKLSIARQGFRKCQ